MDGAAILILIGIILHTSIYRKRNTFRDKLFFQMLLVNIFTGVFDIIVAIVSGREFPGSDVINLTCYTFVYIFESLFGLIMVLFLTDRFLGDEKKTKKLALPFSAPLVITVLMYLIGIPNGFFISIDQQNICHDTRLYPIPLVIMGIYGVAALVLVFMYNKKFGSVRTIPVWIYIIPVSAIIIVPYVFKGIHMSAIGFAVVIAYMHIGVMNETFFAEGKVRKADGTSK